VRVAVTGADGFLGWHTRCALKARGDDIVPVDRALMADRDRLATALRGVDVVVHSAGVNRAEADALRATNLSLAVDLTSSLDRAGERPTVLYANSIQSGNGSPFGDGKQAAAEHLVAWGGRSGAVVADVRLPNLFGEHGRPHYNSVVATFCYELATGGTPVVEQDRELSLLHVQDAVDVMLALADNGRGGVVEPRGQRTSVSALLRALNQFHDTYASGDIPDIADPFRVGLFNTYRSFCFPQLYPISPQTHADQRGRLFECVRAHGGQAQVFCSTSHPRVVRGEHFHRRKIERFLVLSGTAEIRLRRLFHHDVIRFRVCGDRPAFVDMPTMWAHSIENTGDTELMTMFWAHEILDQANPDTYPERVHIGLDQEGGTDD
jgi:UDP-2-acetamido-2,6-beta-L-arabino-hexul-4-ose reductase